MDRSFSIGGKSFTNKTKAEEHIREILSRYGPMQSLSGDDLAFIVAIMEAHPNAEAVVDCGVKRIVVQHLGDKYRSRRFVAVRLDGSIRDFTWRNALYPKDSEARVLRACRFAVRDQIRNFKEGWFRDAPLLSCEVSGDPITASTSDVDHIPPRTFKRLVAAWIGQQRLDYSDIGLTPAVGYEQPDKWDDVFLEENWRDYHRTHAHLRVIHSVANRSTVRKAANRAGDA